ncbi:hypothetical protein V6N11_035613 [Hibiscus sabdariffa]|uniref:Uncharacterized protein n=1 Tax=Hibiscus sabdariffa TaxID=183260 RepID=A0ABR2N740_9ROSI
MGKGSWGLLWIVFDGFSGGQGGCSGDSMVGVVSLRELLGSSRFRGSRGVGSRIMGARFWLWELKMGGRAMVDENGRTRCVAALAKGTMVAGRVHCWGPWGLVRCWSSSSG